jgi:oxygen-independent coproporphyrinogen-3 oxidase
MNPYRVSRELLARYSGPVPRYTSYPTAPAWGALAVGEAEALLDDAASATSPLSLYVHLPFCRKLCFYCGCNMLVTRSASLVERYLAALLLEIRRAGERFGHRRKVVQLHWGGGTPTHLDCEQLARVHRALREAFEIVEGAEQSIEVHPPVTTAAQVETLAALGFNRVSMGVQDFDPVVQKAVNRPQPFEQTRDLIAECRRLGFQSVNVDLMYGLPHQSLDGFSATLARLAELRPDRVALFGYAHVPQLKPHQKLLPVEALPEPPLRLALFEGAVERLVGLGYRYIGLDHFALEGDELSRAQAAGTLRRNFMGYTTCAESDVLAFGSSAISELGPAYLQNAREVPAYLEAMAERPTPVTRGARLSDDDLIRKAVLHQLFCTLALDEAEVERQFPIRFAEYFAPEQARLQELARDGLVELAPGRVRVTPVGQILLRNVASVFDAHLRPAQRASPLSQAV